MTRDEFKILYKKFTTIPLPKNIWQSPEYLDYIDKINNDPKVENFFLEQELQKRRISPSKYCCVKLGYYISNSKDLKNDPDNIIMYDPKKRSFGIPIQDGGDSYIKIYYCPWCGKKF